MSETIFAETVGNNTVNVSIYRESLLPESGAVPATQTTETLSLVSPTPGTDNEDGKLIKPGSELEKLKRETNEKQRKFIRYPEILPKEDELNILNATAELEVIETEGNHDRILTSSIEVSSCIDGKNYLVAIVDIQVDIPPLLLHSVGDVIKNRVKCFNDDLKFSPGYFSSHSSTNKPAITFTMKKYSAFLGSAALKASEPILIPNSRNTRTNYPNNSFELHRKQRKDEDNLTMLYPIIAHQKITDDDGPDNSVDIKDYANNFKKRQFSPRAFNSITKKSKPNNSTTHY